MAVVVFYEKPGCSGNARQKAVLKKAGHQVQARSLLATPWTVAELRSFLDPLPVAQWFNRNSPAVKSGEIVPEACDAECALALMLAHPLLIRRPLLEVDGVRRAGFEVAAIDAWIGLAGVSLDDNLEACQHGADGHKCSGHDGEHDHEPCATLET